MVILSTISSSEIGLFWHFRKETHCISRNHVFLDVSWIALQSTLYSLTNLRKSSALLSDKDFKKSVVYTLYSFVSQFGINQFTLNTIRKVIHLSKNSILTKPQHLHEFHSIFTSFSPQKIDNSLGISKLNFWTKNEDAVCTRVATSLGLSLTWSIFSKLLEASYKSGEIRRFLWEFVFMSNVQTKLVMKHYCCESLN